MNKLLKTLLAGVAIAALSGGAYAADQDKARDSGKDVQNQTQGAPVQETGKEVDSQARDASRDTNQGQTAGTVDQENKDNTAQGRDPKKEDYQAALKKCDSMSGSQKKICVDDAKKKHGQM